jgi:hypothetical protein
MKNKIILAVKDDVRVFLDGFFAKLSVFEILFVDNRGKNSQSLLSLEISSKIREEIIKSLIPEDYCEGPKEEILYGGSEMWVFGKEFKGKEIYIKISMGRDNQSVLCISFHESEREMKYPFKKPKS